MAIRDRNIATGQNASTVYLVFHRPGTGAIPASTTGLLALPYIRNARIIQIGATCRAKANSDNTVTLTFLTGSTTIGTVSFTSGGTLSPSSTVNIAHVAGATLSVNSGALGGTSPSFNDVVIYFVLRTGGHDIHN